MELLQVNPQISNIRYILPGQHIRLPKNQSKRKIIVNGYTFPFADLTILAESLPYLSYLSVFSYEVNSDGTLNPINDTAVIEKAITFRVAPRMVISNISGQTELFDAQLAHDILASETAVNTLIESVLNTMFEKNYLGLDIDFENLYPEDRDLYNNFIIRISGILHQFGFTLSTALEKKTSDNIRVYAAQDFRVHGIYCDYIILMTYDWGYLYGPPMAISPINRVEEVLQYAVTVIPSHKILMGIPNYAFDWTLPFQEGNKASPLSHVDAVELAWERKVEIQYDTTAQAPFFYYYDDEKREHVVWFEDARSIYAKFQLINEYNLGGVSYWTVNKSFPQNWTLIDSMFEVERFL